MSETNDEGRVLSDEERARAVLEQLKSVHAFDLAYEMMVGLVSFGYQKMGLTDETRPVRDLGDARLSIELLRGTLAVVERDAGEGRTRDLRDTLAQMQLAYAHAVQLANAEQGAAEAAAAREREEAPAEPEKAKGGATEQPAAHEPATGKKPAAKKRPAGTKKAAGKKKPAGGG